MMLSHVGLRNLSMHSRWFIDYLSSLKDVTDIANNFMEDLVEIHVHRSGKMFTEIEDNLCQEVISSHVENRDMIQEILIKFNITLLKTLWRTFFFISCLK